MTHLATTCTRLLLIGASLRRASFNARLLHHVSEFVDERFILDVLHPGEVHLPLFDQDAEADPVILAHLVALHRRISDSHGLIVATPEYNGQVTPFLKNLVDWVSRLPRLNAGSTNPFLDRPVLLCSASTGWSGGALAIQNARALFGYLGCQVLGDSVCVPYADQAWTEDGFVFDPVFDDQVAGAVERICRAATHFRTDQSQPLSLAA